MADGTITVTIDTGEWVYIDSNGTKHTVTNGETFTLYSTDMGTGAIYRPLAGASVACTDGTRINIHGYTNIQDKVQPAGDTAVTHDNKTLGEWMMSCTSDGMVERWKCVSLDMDDADNPTAFTTAVFEKVENPAHTFTWSGVTCALE